MTAVAVLTWMVNTTFVLASLAVLRLWLRHRQPAARWLVGTFAAIDVIILVSLLPETTTDHGLALRMLVVVLMATPYLLYRFADAVVFGRPAIRRVAGILLVAIVVATLAIPELPAGDVTEAGALGTAWVFLILLFWGWLNILAGWMLLRASVGEPGVVRNRLRVLAVAAIGLGLYIPASALVLGEDASPAAEATGQLISVGLGLMFLVGFAPPALLRAAWREGDERRLYETAVGLMAAQHPDDVAAVVAPGVRALTGAPSVTMRSRSGRAMAHAGIPPEQVADVRDVVRRTVGTAELEIVATPVMPLFGADESSHIDRLTLLATLALDRVRLLEAERTARRDVERLNDELESFVYTTSHDLKNPVIAMMGYLDVLLEDHADHLRGDMGHIVERMRVNARHMDSLIRDLLALSRVGRVDVAPERVDLEALVDDLARDLEAGPDGARVVRGRLPDLHMNATRARQLLANLFDNAAAYGGRSDITVSVSAELLDSGGVRIVVRDNGRGIEEDHLERVFGVFERLDPEAPGGTGMGLAICRRVVEHLGGAMYAVPSTDGAVFHVDLPETAVHEPSRDHVPMEGSPT